MLKDIEKWKNARDLDLSLKNQLQEMDEQELHDAFYTNIKFGTAGMRGIMGAGTNRINIYTIRKATLGFARYIKAHHKEKAGVAIAYDNRHMSKKLADDIAHLLSNEQIKVYLFEDLRPTPELSFAVREYNCYGGIMITASHNPKEYNGYKLYDDKGCQLIPSLVEEVSRYIDAIEDELSIKVDYSNGDDLIQMIGTETDERYLEMVSSVCFNDQEINKNNLKIIFSPEHGTANMLVPKLFDKHHYKYKLVADQAYPDPDFKNTLTPNPEDPKAYVEAIELAKKENADIILVCDPDADRMGVGVKSGDGYQLLSGNESAAVLLEYILSQLVLKNELSDNAVMFNTVVTSTIGEKIADSYGVECEKTLIGFKFIGEKIAKYEQSQMKDYVFGYEESYGSLIKPFVRDKDAMQACLLLAEASCYYKDQGKTLIDVLNDLYIKHGYYKDSQDSIFLEGEKGSQMLKGIMETFRSNPIHELGGYNIVKIEDFKTLKSYDVISQKETSLEGFYSSNMIKYNLEDGSFVAVRPSGTEPKCKFYYCIHGHDLNDCQNKEKLIKAAIQDIVKK